MLLNTFYKTFYLEIKLKNVKINFFWGYLMLKS